MPSRVQKATCGVIICVVIMQLLSSCSSYTYAERPPRTLNEPIYLVRTEDGMVEAVTERPNAKYYILKNGMLDDEISLSGLRSDAPQLSYGAVISMDTCIIADRRIIEGATHNLRDLGGLFTKDGYQVKWGMLYRSDQLNGVKKKHYEGLEQLGINSICDFRLEKHIKKKPDRWPGLDTMHRVHIPIGDGNVKGREVLKKFKDDTYDAEDHLTEANHNYVVKYQDEYRRFFQLVLQGENYPILYHCTAGKDRTGFASAMILSALNVDRQQIIDEYMMTNYYAHEHIEKNVRLGARLLGVDQDKVRAIAGVRLRYIEEAFSTIEAEYGSVENYLCEALEVCDVEVEQLKGLLLYGFGSR